MERRTVVLLVLAAVVVSALAAWFTMARVNFVGAARDRDGGRSVTVERALTPFSTIRIRGSADVTLVQGTAPKVVIESASGAPVIARVEHGRLLIDSAERGHGWLSLFKRTPRTPPQLTITFTDLARLEFAGSVKAAAAAIRTPRLAIEVTGSGTLDLAHLDVDELDVEGSGRVKAVVAGRATHQRIAISGAGDYQAGSLASETASVDVSGAGSVLVNATRTLRVDISGAGAVDYLGDPAVTKSISGMGKVRRVGGERQIRFDMPRAPLLPPDRRRPGETQIAAISAAEAAHPRAVPRA